MGKVISISIQTIVTAQARVPESDVVIEHELCIDLIVTGFTHRWIESRDVLAMTIATKKRFILSLGLMPL